MRNGVRVLVAGLVLGTVCAAFPGTAMSQSDLLTREEALAAVFPGARFEAERVFLTDDQITRAQELAGWGVDAIISNEPDVLDAL